MPAYMSYAHLTLRHRCCPMQQDAPTGVWDCPNTLPAAARSPWSAASWFQQCLKQIFLRMYRCPGAGRLLLGIASTNVAAPSRSAAHQGAKAGAKVDRSSRKYGKVWEGVRVEA